MTTTEAFAIFDVLQDKYGAPYFPSDWKEKFFNMAQYEYLHDLLPEEGGDGVNYEFDENITTTLQPLLWTVNVSMNSSGLVPQATLDTAIQTVSGDSTTSFFKILNAGLNISGQFYPIQYVKYNNLRTYQANVFKSPSFPKNVRYTFTGNGIQFFPTFTSNQLTISVIKNPRSVSLSPNVNPEWSDYVCYNLIAKMLKYAGITTDAPELINDVRMASIAQ